MIWELTNLLAVSLLFSDLTALKISSDVAGATVMAVGTSSPELYSAIIGENACTYSNKMKA